MAHLSSSLALEALQLMFQRGLDAKPLLALAQTCKQLFSAAQKYSADLTHGTEPFAVNCQRVTNELQLQWPSAFQYTAAPGKSLVLRDLKGCQCYKRCSDENPCPCSQGPSECGPCCSCSLECGNRKHQQGLTVPIQLLFGERGWAAYTCAHIAAGQFVCLYVGEQLTNRQADARLTVYDAVRGGANHALLIVREHLYTGSCLRLSIDATRRGNVARFFNHACDGGVLALQVSRRKGDLVPHVALIARDAIAKGTELTFAYGPPSSSGSRICSCKTSACLGWLPGPAM